MCENEVHGTVYSKLYLFILISFLDRKHFLLTMCLSKTGKDSDSACTVHVCNLAKIIPLEISHPPNLNKQHKSIQRFLSPRQ